MALMTWAFKRQAFYVIILVLFFLIFGFLIISPSLKKAPSCTDGIQNGNETGVDCGGSCLNACLDQVDPISILWARAFEIVPGRYNAVAYIENHNKNDAIEKITYRFRFADSNNVYIGKREGSTYIPPSGRFAIFEPAVDTGSSIPVHTTFEFTQTPQWLTVSQEKIDQLKVLVSNIDLTGEGTNPVLSALIKNNSLFTIEGMDVVAILYDADHNAISASRTYLDGMKGEEVKDINFTWPEPLSGKVIEKEIIPMYNIFQATLK